MSGGHFNYKQYEIGQIADEIEQFIVTNDSQELDEWGSEKGRHYPPEIIERFKIAAQQCRIAQAMIQRVDWLVSGDDGPESFLKRWDVELQKLETHEHPQDQAPRHAADWHKSSSQA